MGRQIEVPGVQLQNAPPIYLAVISGRWLLQRTTPVWRIHDPEDGFQRVVKESRAREIAIAVLDQGRTFPNALVLATDQKTIRIDGGSAVLPEAIRFLVVDGQHRLWAQKFSMFPADYACVIHTGLDEVEMARLFLEINDNQKRVPSSLRWDLVRLVRPEDKPFKQIAADIVWMLATEEQSPLYQQVDLTGEVPGLILKQGSIAPEIERLVASKKGLGKYSFDQQADIITQFIASIRDIDRDEWGRDSSTFFKARVLRALLRILGDLAHDWPLSELDGEHFIPVLRRIDAARLAPEAIRMFQASAGVKAIYDQISAQISSS